MKAFFQFFDRDRIDKIFIVAASLFFLIFAIFIWHLILLKVYLPGVEHPKKLVLLMLGLIWTSGFISILLIKTSLRFKLYSLLMLNVGTILYDGWITHWGFKLNFHLFFDWRTRFFILSGIFIILCLPIWIRGRKSKVGIRLFSKPMVQEIFIFILIFSLVFFVTLESYTRRNPANWHPIYFSERHLFTGHYRLLIPSFIEVAHNLFSALHFDYFADLQRLYKIYMLTAMTLAIYLYYYFLKIFFKKENALLISILLLLLFYLSFKVAGLIEDPLNLLSFVIGLILIYYRKDFFLWLLIFISSFNKELIFFLVFMYFIHNTQFITRKNWIKIFEKTSLMAVTFILVMLFKIFIKPIKEFDENAAIAFSGFNITCTPCILKAFLILNIFWVFSLFFKEYPKQLRFFSRLNFITPFYILYSNLTFMREMRFAIIIALILLPLGMGLLFPDSLAKKEKLQKTNDKERVRL